MNARDLANLLNRAAAAIEAPEDLSPAEREALIKSLLYEALQLNKPDSGPATPPRPYTATRGMTADIPPLGRRLGRSKLDDPDE